MNPPVGLDTCQIDLQAMIIINPDSQRCSPCPSLTNEPTDIQNTQPRIASRIGVSMSRRCVIAATSRSGLVKRQSAPGPLRRLENAAANKSIRTFGGHLRSKREEPQEREASLACALLNRVRELGRPDFLSGQLKACFRRPYSFQIESCNNPPAVFFHRSTVARAAAEVLETAQVRDPALYE